MMSKKTQKIKKQNYYICCLCGNKINPDSSYIKNIYSDDKKCLKCGLGIVRIQ